MTNLAKYTVITFLLLTHITIPGFSAENYDFRKTRWGMTPTRVKASENKQPMLENSDDTFYRLFYVDKLAGLSTKYVYAFIDNKLVRAIYHFDETHTNKNLYINDYLKIKEILTRKYGQPTKEQKVWFNNLFKNDPSNYGTAVSVGHLFFQTNWETPNTHIILRLNGDNYQIALLGVYLSKKYFDSTDDRIRASELKGF